MDNEADKSDRLQLACEILMQRNQALIGQLARDAVEYSKKNPAIEPILENAHLLPPKTGAGAAAAAATNGKPVSK